MSNDFIRIAHLSDIHLFADKQSELLGVKTYESFSEIIKLLKSAATQPNLMILSGDLSQDNSKESYFHLIEILNIFSFPIYFIPGNHDDNDLMMKLLPSGNISPLKHIILEHWHIILLNSQKEGEVPGFLDDIQLKYMKTCLEMYPEHHAIIVFHHPPMLVETGWLAPLGLQNAEEFWHILRHYPKVHTVLFGHVHQEHQGQKNGINYFSTPSTCIQFKKNTKDFKLEKLGPAYRWIDLYPNGELKTGVVRVDHYIGHFDEHAQGY